MVRPNGPRDPIAGPDTPQPPFPLKLRGPVIKGFGRGSKELGIPTANIPLSGLSIGGNDSLDSGIYYGFCTLDHRTISSSTSSTSVPSATSDTSPPERSSNHAVADLEYPSSKPTTTASSDPIVYPTVLSIGYNPYYKNTQRSIEIHILANFDRDFYGATLSLLILGFIRPEYDYVSKDALVEDIREDIRVAGRSLDREGYRKWKADGWLKGEDGEGGGNVNGEQVGQTDVVGKCQAE
ncbi:riboflavin kinase-domain-containing protein [Paraphoma chrysanthemicola]|uniref:Riboflavin kinase n=1 Tax=Paraphoma chrysanthemicola TaxID=798071 RepID=A0A8K0QY55_9PLEO|nr:riboflavin kinase-domain-containing protein [Paraphoma chrysanthemicola]